MDFDFASGKFLMIKLLLNHLVIKPYQGFFKCDAGEDFSREFYNESNTAFSSVTDNLPTDAD